MRIFGREANNLNGHIETVEQNGASQPTLTLADAAAFGLVAEWQERGPESFSAHAFRKLRLTLAPTPSAITACAG